MYVVVSNPVLQDLLRRFTKYALTCRDTKPVPSIAANVTFFASRRTGLLREQFRQADDVRGLISINAKPLSGKLYNTESYAV